MKLIISPAKKMNVDTDTLAPLGEPVLLEKTEALLSRMRELSYEEAKALWGCNEKLARQNFGHQVARPHRGGGNRGRIVF